MINDAKEIQAAQNSIITNGDDSVSFLVVRWEENRKKDDKSKTGLSISENSCISSVQDGDDDVDHGSTMKKTDDSTMKSSSGNSTHYTKVSTKKKIFKF